MDNAESMAAVTGTSSNTVFGMTKETIIVVWTAIIFFIYYIIATLLPIDKIIGRVYPIFWWAFIIHVAWHDLWLGYE